jgi:hypothetical protein
LCNNIIILTYFEQQQVAAASSSSNSSSTRNAHLACSSVCTCALAATSGVVTDVDECPMLHFDGVCVCVFVGFCLNQSKAHIKIWPPAPAAFLITITIASKFDS